MSVALVADEKARIRFIVRLFKRSIKYADIRRTMEQVADPPLDKREWRALVDLLTRSEDELQDKHELLRAILDIRAAHKQRLGATDLSTDDTSSAKVCLMFGSGGRVMHTCKFVTLVFDSQWNLVDTNE